MIDLRKTINCLNVMKENGTYRGHKIGMIRKDIPTEVSSMTCFCNNQRGQVVLYRDGGNNRLTIEYALTQEEIEKHQNESSLITTIGTVGGVPRKYIEEIII